MAAEAYGIQARPARDFSGAPKADESFVDPTLAAAARDTALREAAKAEKETSGRFGATLEPPTNKAQEKLARAREEAKARARR